MGWQIRCGGYTVCNVWNLSGLPRNQSNAALIAAAPELLELLQELIDIEGPQPGTSDWGDKAIALIAKATGEQP